MMNPLYLPAATYKKEDVCGDLDKEVHRVFELWFSDKMEQLKLGFMQQPQKADNTNYSEVDQLTQRIVNVLQHRTFNYQSKKKCSDILPRVRQTIASSIALKRPIPFLYLYNGGYRATPFSQDSSLIFTPDFTELMLLYQIALFNRKIQTLYSPGIEFTIVINNGVAQYVNDVPLASTEQYVKALRRMIELVGAESHVRVLVQSELSDFKQVDTFDRLSLTVPSISEKEHANIERFIGRSLSAEEAALRAFRYTEAEASWFEEIKAMAQTKQAVLLRQIADGSMLSFRPFPGGAIRSQNGSLGFEYINNTIRLKLITSENALQKEVRILPFPMSRLAVKNEFLYIA